MRPNAVVLCTDATLFPVAMFVAQRLAALKARDDTDIIVFASSADNVASVVNAGLPFEVRLAERPAGLAPGLMREATFLRFFALETLTERRRVLYLDTDVYPENAALFALFDLAMSGRALAAVRDLVIAHAPDASERSATVGGDSRLYFNAGVLLIDIVAYRRQELYAKVVRFLGRQRTAPRFFDQSALNAILRGDWVELSPSFNMMVALWRSALRRVFDPVVVHFAGTLKPWMGPRFAIDHPARQEIEAYLLNSPWKAFLAQQFGLRDALALVGGGLRQAPTGSSADLNFDSDFIGRPAFLRHLRHTEFADVQQGITTPHWEYFPPA
ncbi:MAG TPA: glycosyltransferase [Bauldia sp.]|nr:glycosyltransferase [Bauldia sp.]